LFSIPATGDLTGRVLYYRAGAVEPSTNPVTGVVIDLTGAGPSVPDSTTTSAAGGFTFSNRAFGFDYTLTGAKAGDFGTGIISSFDASLNAQAVVSLITLTPHQLLAADVSGNGSASSFDSAMIAQFAAGLITRFDVAATLGSDWFLIPVPVAVPNQGVNPPIPSTATQGSITYSPLVGAAFNQDFLVGLFGDISGNFVPPPGAAPAINTESTLTFSAETKDAAAAPGKPGPAARFKISNITAAPGEIIQVSIVAHGAEQAVALDLTLDYDAGVLQPIGVEAGKAAAAFTLTTNMTESGRIRLGLFDAKPLGHSGPVAVVTFQVVGGAGDQSLILLKALVDEGRLPATAKDGRVRIRSAPQAEHH
jgi:hypothetical protein